MKRIIRLSLLFIFSALFTTQLMAVGTSSGIRGTLVDADGNPIASQTVVITHTPTGRTKSLTTTANGIFQASGLSVGGPYTLSLKANDSYKADELTGLYLTLGRTESIQMQAVSASSEGAVVMIVGSTSLAGAFKRGPSSDFSDSDIANTAAISRDIKSILKRDSKVVVDSTVNGGPALSIAGGNIRSNSLTVDGVKQNDDFGLNKNGYPGRRTPISLDAIEQLEVNIAPYDVTYGDFQGGNVNIVTKSGTNEFSGSAFYYRSDDSMIGDTSRGSNLNIGSFSEDTYGFTVGGPIIKDKLFFFASYEKFKSKSPYQFTLDNQDGVVDANERIGITQADFDQIAQVARDVWGYDIGGYNVPKIEEDEKLLLKFDYYINEDHRASLTYQDNSGNTVRDYWGETFPSAPWTTAESNRFNQAETLNAYSLQVFSDWSDDFSTEVKISNKKVKTSQNPLLGANFEQMLITTDNGGQLYIGPDMFRHANRLSNERFAMKIKGDYYINEDHKITAGWEHEKLDIYNLFVFGSLGFVQFGSVSDFANNLGFHVYQNALSGNPLDAVDQFQYTVDTFYAQDQWSVSEDLTVTYGLRYSSYTNNDKPTLNPNFVARHGFSNQGNFDGLTLLEPRAGFTYSMDDDTVIRGGIGLFGGGSPNVWLSNSYGNDGRRKVFTGCFACSNGHDIPQQILDNLAAGGFGGSTNVNGDTNAISPDFEIPSVWKLNLGLDRRQDLGFLGKEWLLSTDIILTDVKNAAKYRELNFQQIDTAPDGRPIYDDVAPYDLLLENTSKGGGLVWSFDAAKRFETKDMGTFDFNVGYTFQNLTEVNPGNAFIAFEGYAMPANSDFQSDTEFNSEFEVTHSFVANLTWSDVLFGENMTNISLAYNGHTGRHFSHTMRTSDTFGGFPFAGFADWDAFNSQLLYVPTGANDPLVNFATGFDTTAFFNYIDTQDCLTRGQIADRHACSSSWINRFDLRLLQEVKFGNDQAIEITFDIENVANLLNSDWGRIEGFVQPFNAPVVDASIANGQYVYNNFTKPQQTVAKVPSVWKMQLGVKYRF
ncbi:MAG: TonB-dependent receptor [Enterobacterales bacterium]|nr:TonB-dependent receptor [Enterobacterales bacterium]